MGPASRRSARAWSRATERPLPLTAAVGSSVMLEAGTKVFFLGPDAKSFNRFGHIFPVSAVKSSLTRRDSTSYRRTLVEWELTSAVQKVRRFAL